MRSFIIKNTRYILSKRSYFVASGQHTATAQHEVKTENTENASENFKNVLSTVPQPVVVVTSALYDDVNKTWKKRGATCSSFTGISLCPSVVSFAMRRPSQLYDLLTEKKVFAVHVLAKNQVSHGIHFARPCPSDADQFKDIDHEVCSEGIPVLNGVSAVIHCNLHTVNSIGDHDICYGEVIKSYTNDGADEPLLYHLRKYRSIGDEAFMESFENTTLPFEDWTHEAHLRMAYNYLEEYGLQKATPLIIKGIQKYNEKNKEKISRGFNQTVTTFFIRIIDKTMKEPSNFNLTFDEFITKNKFIQEKDFIFQYYYFETMTSKEALSRWIPPDKKPL